MKLSTGKKIILLTGAFIVLVAAALFYFKGPLKARYFNECVPRYNEPFLGIFNRNASDSTLSTIKLKHITLVWRNTAMWNDDDLLKASVADSDVLVTIETWSNGTWGSTGVANNVLTETLKGDFDPQIERLTQLAKQSGHQVLVRWNPDMEVPVVNYPWQLQSPKLYTAAINYVAAKLKKLAANIKLVWGPFGYPGDSEYWPDASNVDIISITMTSNSEKMLAENPMAHLSASDLLQAKLHHMRFMNKPVLILGGDRINARQFNKRWIADFTDTVKKYGSTIYSPENFIKGDAIKPIRKQLTVGVFDFEKRLTGMAGISAEHIFTDWGEIQAGAFKLKFDSIIARRHNAIVTVEPWKDTTNKPDPAVLTHIISGRYDNEIRKVFATISNTGQTVYLRFAHEMEIPIHRYAWQSASPITYINAYRHFMNFAQAGNIKKVWGPAGDRGSADWWPGNDMVDYISIAIYGLPDKNITYYNRQESFATIFDRKNYRMRFFKKPLFITEFGIKGPESYQRKWLNGAAQVINNKKDVFGICYFNLYDNPKAWGDIKAPDWSISPATMGYFQRNLTR
ncbi:hypothetical protein [Mucilaginibacter terrae]|uniref:Beta-mannanase n=1 Tax=Mucilaginibacter terrae TaxID=1955052 RepID=A0ABU3GNU1_9SPHI|nr:hypothetical protein [Mucilaginibacter terrae]MDT3401464.1 beta-mannanase [Mucilaginibacter terrae]